MTTKRCETLFALASKSTVITPEMQSMFQEVAGRQGDATVVDSCDLEDLYGESVPPSRALKHRSDFLKLTSEEGQAADLARESS